MTHHRARFVPRPVPARFGCGCIAAALLIVCLLAACGPAEPALLIHGAVLVDGSGEPPRPASVRIRDGRIAEVGTLRSGHNTLRRRVMERDFRREATAEEVRAMAALLEEEMVAGGLGLSSGLEYDPGIYASTDEVVELARVAAGHAGRYLTHVRSEDRALWEAIDEAVEVGRRAGLPVQISHMKLAKRGLWGRAGELLERLDRARAEGVEVSADVYPYTYWQSTMTVLFPERDFTDLDAARFAVDERSLLDLIAESRAAAAEGRGGESIIATSMHEDDVARLLQWPHANVSSDGALRGGHPRGFGAFPRVLAHHVRERGDLSLEEAIRRMSALAAAHMGLADRGEIRTGARADLVLLDPEAVRDRATPEDPHVAAQGITRVWVNGVEVYRDGTPTGSRPGRVIPRGEQP